MTLRTTADHHEIASLLDARIAADPVRGTVLGTIRHGLEPSAWAAWDESDDAAVAARSDAQYPVVVTDGWTIGGLDALATALAALPTLYGVAGSAPTVERVVAALGRPVAATHPQRLYRLDDLAQPDVPGSPLPARDAHRHLVRDWMAAFIGETESAGGDPAAMADSTLESRGCWLWVDPDGTPVSMAVRRPVVGGSSRIGPVYTPPAQRGHGYGSAVTAAATRVVLDEGAVPVLFTDLGNATSNSIYQQLGYRAVEDRLVVVFSFAACSGLPASQAANGSKE